MLGENSFVLVVDAVHIMLGRKGSDSSIVSRRVLGIPLNLPIMENLIVILFFEMVRKGVVSVSSFLEGIVVPLLDRSKGLLKADLELLLVVVELVSLFM